jgi:hypothetical protein
MHTNTSLPEFLCIKNCITLKYSWRSRDGIAYCKYIPLSPKAALIHTDEPITKLSTSSHEIQSQLS